MNYTRHSRRKVHQLGTLTILSKLTQGRKCSNIFRTSCTDKSISSGSQYCNVPRDKFNGRELQKTFCPRIKFAGGVILIEYFTILGQQFRSISINWIPLLLNHSLKDVSCSGTLIKYVAQYRRDVNCRTSIFWTEMSVRLLKKVIHYKDFRYLWKVTRHGLDLGQNILKHYVERIPNLQYGRGVSNPAE
jgi:hypothetical protein